MSQISRPSRGFNPPIPRPKPSGVIPSYKKDAIKLIYHRLQRYLIDIFRHIEKVGVDISIQRQREELASFYEVLREDQSTINEIN